MTAPKVYQTPSVSEYASMKHEERQKVAQLIALNKTNLDDALAAERAAKKARTEIVRKAKQEAQAEARQQAAEVRRQVIDNAVLRAKVFASAEVKEQLALILEDREQYPFPVHPEWRRHRAELAAEVARFDARGKWDRKAQSKAPVEVREAYVA